MTADDGFERLITDWLQAEGSENEPAGFHAGFIAVAGRSRQRPRWLADIGLELPVVGPRAQVSGRRIAALLVALTVVLATLAAVVGAAPSLSLLPRNGPIAYSLMDSGEVHLIEPDGSNDRVIGQGRCPTFSADGSVLAWWSGPRPHPSRASLSTLAVSSNEDSTPLIVTGVQENPYDPNVTLSPDGTQIAWLRRSGTVGLDEADGLWISPVSDGPGTRIVPSTYAPGIEYAWSLDGRMIAFKGVAVSGQSGASTIYVVDVRGGDPRAVATRRWGIWRDFAWSPDGRSIAFAAAADDAELPTPGMSDPPSLDTQPAPDLFIAAVDGRGEQKVTNSPGWESRPRWSPDGRWLAYLDEGTLSITSTGSEHATRTPLADPVDGFAWAPDSTGLIANSMTATDVINGDGSSLQDVTTTIWSVTLDGGTRWPITIPEGLTCDPSWRPVIDDGASDVDAVGALSSP